jgi:transcriptional regulator with XRE-family HTH domain
MANGSYEFGRALRALREKHEVPQAELGRALGMAGAYISLVESGRAPLLAPEHLPKVAKALRLTSKEIVHLRRARLMTILEKAFEHELMPQPIARMKAIIATSRPGKHHALANKGGKRK